MVGGKVDFVGVEPRDSVRRGLFGSYLDAQILIRESIGSIIVRCVIRGDREFSIVTKCPGIVWDLSDVPRADDIMWLCAASPKQGKGNNAQLTHKSRSAPGDENSSCTSHATRYWLKALPKARYADVERSDLA